MTSVMLSTTVAGVVSTLVIKLGNSSSQVSVRMNAVAHQTVSRDCELQYHKAKSIAVVAAVAQSADKIVALPRYSIVAPKPAA